VKQTALQKLVAQLLNLSMNSEECVDSSSTYQINRVNMASSYMFWPIVKPSTLVLQKFTRQLATHALGLPVPTQAFLDLVPSGSGTGRNIITDNYYTLIPLNMELKSRKLALVGTMKKNNACITPSILAKANEGIFQYAFDHANNFTVFYFVPKKT